MQKILLFMRQPMTSALLYTYKYIEVFCNKALTLGSWVAILGPAKGMAIHVQECVLLLNAKPGVGVSGMLHHLLTRVPLVGGCMYTHRGYQLMHTTYTRL